MNTKTFIQKHVGWILALVVLVAAVLFGSSPFLFSSLLGTGSSSTGTADIYIPQNYQASPGQQGEIEVKLGKDFASVAGIQLTVNYPSDKATIFDASTTGLPTSAFIVAKNTNTPGSFQLAMAQASGLNLSSGSTVVKLSVEINASTPSGTDIPLTINTVSIVDQSGATLNASTQNGKISVSGGALPGSDPFIQSITPDFGLASEDTNIVIRGRNLPSSVTEIKVGTTLLTNIAVNGSDITATVPKGISAGIYDVSILGNNGQLVKKTGAFTILDSADGLTIDEKASYFSPAKVKNDNTMTTNLWVKVDDLRGVEDVEYVDANISSIGGTGSNRMTQDRIVDKSQWYFIKDIKIPNTIATSSTPYQVTVTAANRVGKVATGKIPITIVNDVQGGIVPVVRQSYTVPASVPNNGKTPFTFFAYVTNDDGADKIGKVVVDLSSVGAAVLTMTKDGEAVGNGFWFKAEGAKVSSQTSEGTYNATITAANVTGETGTGTVKIQVSNSVNAPVIESDSYISPTRVPPDNTTTFSIFPLVVDQDGDDDIAKVTAGFGAMGIIPRECTKGASFGRGNFYECKDLKVPTTTIQGRYRITITATDKQGNTGDRDLDFEVVSPDAVKNAPVVDSNRSYNTPATVANDGKTEVCSYAFATDPDGPADMASANIDLRELGNSPVNTMTEDKTEGKGKWFKFCGPVPPLVAPSSAPYELLVTVTDKSGAVGQGKVLLRVVNTNPTTVTAPAIEAAVPIASDRIEVRFSAPLDPQSILTSGANFQILDRRDISKKLSVTAATLTSSNRIVVLSTASQDQDQPYTLKVDTRVKDQQNRSIRPGFGDQADFRGYLFDRRAPEVKTITATTSNTVEIEFWRCVKPSSVAPDGADFTILDVANSRSELHIFNVAFKDATKLVLTTDEQRTGVNYAITIKNIQTCSGTAVGQLGVEAFFKGFINALRSDLDRNGRVDFADFTIFSFDYGCFRGFSNCNAGPNLNLNNNNNSSSQSNSNANQSGNRNS